MAETSTNGQSVSMKTGGSMTTADTIATDSTENREPIDDDIQHTVGRLFHVRPQHNNLTRGKKESKSPKQCKVLFTPF